MPESNEQASEQAPASSSGFIGLIVAAMVFGIGGALVITLGALAVMEVATLLLGQTVVTATRDIEPGEALGGGNIELTTIPMPGFEHTSDSMEDMIGRVATTEIVQGEPIRSERLAARGRGEGVASLIPKGRRALWLSVDAGAAGLGLEAGDHIDIWASYRLEGGAIQTVSVAEMVELVAVEKGSNKNPGRATVAATTEQLTAVTKYRTEGSIHLVLRADLDAELELSDTIVEANSGGETPLEVHAARDLRPGVALEPEHLTLRHGTGLGNPGFAAVDELVGSVPHGLILAGERLIPRQMADPTVGRGASALLAKGEAVVSMGVGANIDMFEIGSTVTAMTAPPDQDMVPLIEEVPILGHHVEGQGCPCVQLLISADMAGHIVHTKAMNRLALILPE